MAELLDKDTAAASVAEVRDLARHLTNVLDNYDALHAAKTYWLDRFKAVAAIADGVSPDDLRFITPTEVIDWARDTKAEVERLHVEVDHWRGRAETAEDRVDDAAWCQLEADRDRLRDLVQHLETELKWHATQPGYRPRDDHER